MAIKTIYLVAHYLMRPQRRVQTQIKGWKDNMQNISYDEQVAVCRTLKKNDISMAKIILDLSNKKIVRNGWSAGKSFDELFDYFHTGYPQYTTEVMMQLDPEYLIQFQSASMIQEFPEATIATDVTEIVDAEIVSEPTVSSLA